MEKSVVNEGRIYFLNFTFNPKSRTLQQGDTVLQLRKKQSDVLELLCVKYPEPVSLAEFHAEVWGGGYVTSQSLAQIIRSLRISLGDDMKCIIVTIPRLGYKITAAPRWAVPDAESDKPGFESPFPVNTEEGNASLSSQSIINVIPLSGNTMPVSPHSAPIEVPDRKKFSLQTLFLSAVAMFFLVSFFEVWGGGYVALQSIAQPIRSLIISQGDDTTSINDIVTIPKELGYKIAAEPCWEEPEVEPDKSGFESSFPSEIEVDNISFPTPSMINVTPMSANSMSVIPHSASL